MSDAAPWEDYQQPAAAGPWEEYQSNAAAPPADPGFLANAARAARMGLPFGNQFVAAEKTVLPQSLGGSPGFDYGKNLADVNAADARLQREHPVIADLGQGTGAALGALAVPAAVLGEGAQGLGLFGRATRGGLTGAALGAGQGAGAPGSDIRNLPQTAEGGVSGLNQGALLGAAFPVAGWGIGKGVSTLADALRGGPGPADLAGLQAAKSAAYQNVKDLGAAYSPEAFSSLVNDIASSAKEQGINPDLHRGASSVINRMQARAEEGTPVSLPELDQMRQIAWRDSAGKQGPDNGGERFFGNQIRNKIDEFTNSDFPGNMAPMPEAPASNRGTAPEQWDEYEAAMSALQDEQMRSAGTPRASIRDMTPEEEAAADFSGGVPEEVPSSVSPSAPSQRPKVPPGPAPTPMLDFLRRGGGLQDEGGDLASMGFTNLNETQGRDEKGRFGALQKGSGKIIDKENGRPMDEGRRAAVEAGYMEPHETVADFINKLGEHPTYSIHDQEAVAARAARDEYDFGSGEEPSALAQPVPAPHVAPSSPAANPPIPPPENLPTIASRPAASAQESADAINAARDLAQRQFKANALTKALRQADLSTAWSGMGGNIENNTRRLLGRTLAKEPWSQDEKDQLERIIMGTPVTNTLRKVSRLSPLSHALMGGGELATTLTTGSPWPAVAGGIGMAAQGAGVIARRNAQNKLLETILGGGNAPAQSASTPRLSRSAIAAALAANANLQGQRNQAPQP